MIPKVVVGELTISGRFGKLGPWRFAMLGPFGRGDVVKLPPWLVKELERRGIVRRSN